MPAWEQLPAPRIKKKVACVCVILAVMFLEKPKKEPLWSFLFHCSTLQHRSFLLSQLNSTGLSHMWICQTQVLLIKRLTTTFCWGAPVRGSCCWLPGMPKCNWANFNIISYTCAFLSHEELKMSVKSLFQMREVNSPFNTEILQYCSNGDHHPAFVCLHLTIQRWCVV